MRSEWITSAEAAALVGCHRHTIDRHAQAGDIDRRYPPGRKTPTLSRASVEEFAKRWDEEQAEVERRRAERRPSGPTGPPDDGDVWLDAPTTALVLGCTAQWVGRLAIDERLPAVKVGKKWWVRRRDVEQLAAARAIAGVTATSSE